MSYRLSSLSPEEYAKRKAGFKRIADGYEKQKEEEHGDREQGNQSGSD